MDAIIQFFQGIGTAITSLFDFLFSMVSDLVYLIGLTGKFLAQIPKYFSWLPPQLLSILVSIFAIVVLYKIFGREG